MQSRCSLIITSSIDHWNIFFSLLAHLFIHSYESWNQNRNPIKTNLLVWLLYKLLSGFSWNTEHRLLRFCFNVTCWFVIAWTRYEIFQHKHSFKTDRFHLIRDQIDYNNMSRVLEVFSNRDWTRVSNASGYRSAFSNSNRVTFLNRCSYVNTEGKIIAEIRE